MTITTIATILGIIGTVGSIFAIVWNLLNSNKKEYAELQVTLACIQKDIESIKLDIAEMKTNAKETDERLRTLERNL